MRSIPLVLLAACGFPEPADVVGPPAQKACCLLVASAPELARAGDTLTLEGTFDATSSVTFPGGESVALTLLGEHRATAAVPAGATAGNVTMTFDGAAVGSVPFRRVTFSPELAPFALRDPQASGARQDVTLAQPRSGATATAIGRWVYLVGGASAGIASPSVERAAMFPDGTLGPFALVSDVTLVTARSQHQAVVIGDFLYVIGGSDGTSAIAGVERAPITGGALGTFESMPDVALTTPRAEASGAVIGAWWYAIGGTNASGPTGAIERAPIGADGALGAFEPVPAALMTARKGHASLATRDALYVMVGSSGAALDSIERLPIDADGNLGAAAPAGIPNSLAPRDGAIAVRLADSFCLLGGAGRADIECAPIAPDGALGAFIASPAMLTATRLGAAATLVANNLFVFGGGAAASQVERAGILTGALGAFATATPQTTPAVNPGAWATTVVGDNVYYMGLDVFERARVPLDGTLGSFGPTSATPVASTYSHAAVVIGKYYYVIAGSRSTGNVARVERAVILPDGTLEPFVTVPGVTLTKPRQGHTCVVIGNSLYVFGGISGTTTQQFEGSVERATINPDGSLSTFAVVSGINFTARTQAATVVIGNSIYMIGGRVLAGPLAAVERVIMNPDGTLDGVTSSSSLSRGRTGPSLAVVGSYLYVLGGSDGADTMERARIENGMLGTFSALPAKLLVPRATASSIVLGNSLYVIGGASQRTVEAAELQ